MNHKMNICYTSDDRFAVQTGISILSLILNHDQKSNIRIFLIDDGMADANLKKIQRICDNGHTELVVYEAKELIARLRRSIYSLENERGRITTVLRLFMGELLPDDVDRVLYLDGDTLVEHPLTDLFFQPFQEPVAAVIDANFDYHFTMRRGYQKGNYFNSGILLINLRQYREVMTDDVIMPILAKKPMFDDQDALNILFRNNFHKLSPEYNASIRYRLLNHEELARWMNWDPSPYTKNQLDKARRYPTIIHYTWSVLGRPWEQGSLDPDKDRWITYFRRSPWKTMEMERAAVSKKKQMMRVMYRCLPLNLFMRMEYQYFKYSFLKTIKRTCKTRHG